MSVLEHYKKLAATLPGLEVALTELEAAYADAVNLSLGDHDQGVRMMYGQVKARLDVDIKWAKESIIMVEKLDCPVDQ